MDHLKIAQELSANREVFSGLLTGLTHEQYLWKPLPEKWCLLEVVCHLYDEEREDFRARTRHVLETPGQPLPPIDPVSWVKERKYHSKNYTETLERFLEERIRSVEWLQSLNDPKWDNAHHHPKFGAMSARLFLCNWLAHDHLHIRQIVGLKFGYLQSRSEEPLSYAGEW